MKKYIRAASVNEGLTPLRDKVYALAAGKQYTQPNGITIQVTTMKAYCDPDNLQYHILFNGYIWPKNEEQKQTLLDTFSNLHIAGHSVSFGAVNIDTLLDIWKFIRSL